MKSGITALLLVSITTLLFGCEINDPSYTGEINFTLEYDHQESWECFPFGLSRALTAFDKADTFLDVVTDNTDLPDMLVPFVERQTYVYHHRQLDQDSMGVYPGYLCGIKAFADEYGIIIDTLLGLTRVAGPGKGWSFVCSRNCDTGLLTDKTAIHELGHQRANLQHLCLDFGTMDTLHHNAVNCVMGHGAIATCTAEDLISYPEFCDYCCDALRAQGW
jgi:hypothetical protein